MFREDHTRSRSRSRDAASGTGNRRVVIVLVPPLRVFFASRCHLPPPNIWLAILWLVLGIDFGVVPWTSGNRGYASPSPFEGAEFRAVSEPRALFEPLSGLRPLQFSETSHCISVEGSRPSANMYHAPLPIEGKMSLRCRAGIMPCLDPPVEPMPYPHLCTRYRGATECSDRANPDVRQATPLHAYLCGLHSRSSPLLCHVPVLPSRGGLALPSTAGPARSNAPSSTTAICCPHCAWPACQVAVWL